MTREQFLRERSHLFWGVRDPTGLSDAAVVEGVLNGGDMADVRALCTLLGRRRVASIFRSHLQSRGRSNYDPRLAHFFSLYFRQPTGKRVSTRMRRRTTH